MQHQDMVEKPGELQSVYNKYNFMLQCFIYPTKNASLPVSTRTEITCCIISPQSRSSGTVSYVHSNLDALGCVATIFKLNR